jgi:hypothetical protein
VLEKRSVLTPRLEHAATDPSPATTIAFLLDRYFPHEAASQADRNGITPLHLTAIVLNVAAATALLEIARVDANPVEASGLTPRDMLDLHRPSNLERASLHPLIGAEITHLVPKDDMDRLIKGRRLKAMKELFAKHRACRGVEVSGNQHDKNTSTAIR